MAYRTLAHGSVGSSELKLWVVTERRISNPREYIISLWDDAVEETSTFRGVAPVSFEFNEPTTDEPEGIQGQAIYRTDHGKYVYDWDSPSLVWEGGLIDRDETLEYPEA